jgi:ankyrin repeat protein
MHNLLSNYTKILLRYALTCLLLFTSLQLSADDDLSLVQAARVGDSESVARLLSQSINVDSAEADGTTALHWAAHRNDMQTAELLLFAEANVDVSNDYGVTPLQLACTNRSDEMVKKILTAGANPNAALLTGETVLMNCARTGSTEAVVALLAKGANPNAREKKKGQTALMWAVAEGHGNVTALLVESGADISARSNSGFTPLLYASRSGDVQSGRTLLDAGANPNEATPVQGNSLVIAAAGGHEALALLLLQSGADPDSTDQYGITPLHHAVANGLAALNGVRYDPVYRVLPKNMPGLARALLETGADPDVQITESHRRGPDGSPFDMEGATPFLLAAVSADEEMMQLFNAHGADPNIVAKGGISSLMAAARSSCTGACAFKGGGNESKDEEIAISYRAVKIIVDMGININAKNDDGRTAMHMAAFTGAETVVKYLAENGADVNVVDNYGETPWSMASGISPVIRYRGLYGYHPSTVTLLEKLGANSTSRDNMDSNAPAPPGQ